VRMVLDPFLHHRLGRCLVKNSVSTLKAATEVRLNCTGVFKVAKGIFVWTFGSVMLSFTEPASDIACTSKFDPISCSIFMRLFNFRHLSINI
jgi:hypothetical protein